MYGQTRLAVTFTECSRSHLDTMNLQMMGEVRVLTKGLLTLLTLVGFLPRMDSQVLGERRIESKGLPTVFALEGLFTSVNALV